ncbi:MAG: class I SAM-dependent methyltransferase [Ignavibacteria bacterium]
MKIKDLQKNWDWFGRTDPLWAILTDNYKKGGKWDLNEFFLTGEQQIANVMKYIGSLGIKFSRNKALDFGCGVGRLTQPLAQYFDEVYGIDIAPSMISLAKKYNRYSEKCRYYLNETNDLKLFPDNNFSFIYTSITLQHLKPSYSKNYIKEFLRVLSPHGILIFQLPSNKIIGTGIIKKLKALILRIVPKTLIDITYRNVKYISQPRMEMYGIERVEVIRLLEENRAKIMDIIPDQSAGSEWVSFQYCVTKKINA